MCRGDGVGERDGVCVCWGDGVGERDGVCVSG